MIRNAAIYVAVILTTSIFYPGFARADWSDQAFPVKTHNFGTVAVSSKTEFRFPIYNTLSSEMHIETIRASCGCTTPIIETKYIPPGGSGSILARFNTGTFRGKKGATLTVVVTKPFYNEVRLRVDGYIRSDMVFHPGSIEYGKIDQGQPRTGLTKVLYAGRNDWRIVDVQSNQPWLQPSVSLSTRGSGRVNYDLSVRVREDAPIGYFQDEVVVVTNDRAMPRIPLRVAGQVESPLSISPQAIALGRLKPGQSVEKRLVIRGREAFQIQSIDCDGWDVACDATPIAKSTHIISARFTPTDAIGAQKVPVRIRTTGEPAVTATALLTADVREQ